MIWIWIRILNLDPEEPWIRIQNTGKLCTGTNLTTQKNVKIHVSAGNTDECFSARILNTKLTTGTAQLEAGILL